MKGTFRTTSPVHVALLSIFILSYSAARADIIYVSTGGLNTILDVESGGPQTVFASSNLSDPVGIAFDSSGNLFVANAGNNTIKEFNSSGTGHTFASSSLSLPWGIAFDSSGNLFVANAGNNTIKEFNSSGTGAVVATASFRR